jgi:hypothetical protein
MQSELLQTKHFSIYTGYYYPDVENGPELNWIEWEKMHGNSAQINQDLAPSIDTTKKKNARQY